MTEDAQVVNIPEERYYWPNKLARMYLLALEEVAGKNAINAALNHAGLRHRISNYPPDNLDLGWSFEEMSGLNQALEAMHGRRAGKALAVRTGRVWFRHALKDFGAVLGISDLAFRLLPLGMKVKLGLGAMADTFNKISDQIVRVEEEKDRFLYCIDRCPECWGRTADLPVCHADLGLLREGLRWATGGKKVRVKEILCIAKGDPSCTYRIDREPLK